MKKKIRSIYWTSTIEDINKNLSIDEKKAKDISNG